LQQFSHIFIAWQNQPVAGFEKNNEKITRAENNLKNNRLTDKFTPQLRDFISTGKRHYKQMAT
jgi:tRNA1(Val) A37 N6-methylase TrmN6